VAYSVHDVEDGLHAGLVSLKNLSDSAERSRVSAVASPIMLAGVEGDGG